MGMIYQRGKTWWIKYYHNGRPVRESSKSTKEAEAKRLLKLREGEISTGKTPGFYFDKVTFEELAQDFLTDRAVNGKGVMEAKKRLKHLEALFGGMKVTAITTPRIQKYIQGRLEAGAANASINRELAALKRMFNLGAKQTPPKVALVPYIPMLTENNVRTGFFEPHEFQALMKHLPDYLKSLTVFAYQTGWRSGEIRGLTWEQVDLREGVVRLDPGQSKNREARTLYLNGPLKEILSEALSKRRLGCPFVFHREGLQIKDFRDAWTRACQAAGLKGRLFHDLRRTAVRNMVRAGIPERVAMMVSGHKTRSVFERYNVVSAEDLKQAGQRLADYLGHSPGTILGTIGENGEIGGRDGQGQLVEITGARGGNRTRTRLGLKGF